MLDTQLKGIPRHTCHYKPDKKTPGIFQAGCCGEWLVLQDTYLHCPYCGSTIERNPPPKPRTVT